MAPKARGIPPMAEDIQGANTFDLDTAYTVPIPNRETLGQELYVASENAVLSQREIDALAQRRCPQIDADRFGDGPLPPVTIASNASNSTTSATPKSSQRTAPRPADYPAGRGWLHGGELLRPSASSLGARLSALERGIYEDTSPIGPSSVVDHHRYVPAAGVRPSPRSASMSRSGSSTGFSAARESATLAC